jgi:ferrous iron transport protein B
MLKIAFAGNPNVGKTALINAIAGSKLKVGNWPGVTVEKKEAEFIHEGTTIKLVDLPGVYSLSPYTMEEIITRDYILTEKPDVIINVVDSTNLERNLYLTTLLKELGKPMVLALNLYDEFKKLDYKLDMKKFTNLIGMEAIPTSAKTKDGLKELLNKAIEVANSHKEQNHIKYELRFNHIIEDEIKKVREKVERIDNSEKLLQNFSMDYITIKLLEEDKHFLEKIEKFGIDGSTLVRENIETLERHFDEDVETIFAEGRYGAIKGILAKVFTTSLKGRLDFTDKVDKILLSRIFGPISFVFIMLLIFTFTFNGSGPYIDWVDGFIGGYLGKYIGIAVEGTPDWLQSFVIDGLIGGLGGVLVFVPLMIFLYFFLAILEESGYMSRVAFLMDKVMRGIGLNGKAFLPMILGFGCSVPGIYATRTLEDEKSRRLTALITPLMSCGARLPVYALFTAAFFGKKAGVVIASLYILGIVVAIALGKAFSNHPYFKAEEKALLIELPPYRIPTAKMVLSSTFRKTWSYVKKAGTIILGMLVLLWALMYFPNNGDVQSSFIGKFGKAVQPIFRPAGFGDRWEPVAAIPPSLVAKEVVVGFMGQVLDTAGGEEEEEVTTFGEDTAAQLVGFKDATVDAVGAMVSFDVLGLFTAPSEDEVKEQGGSGVIDALRSLWADDSEGQLKAYAYLVFVLLVIPCVVTLGAYVQEFGWNMLGLVLVVYTLIPYFASILVYQIGRLFI